MNKFFARKSIAIMVMIAFFSMVTFAAYPAGTEQAAKTEKQEEVKKAEATAEAESAAEVNEYYSRDDANVIEDEGYPGGSTKKFPWLLVAGGAVVVGAILYFTVFKVKKFELNVTVGTGATGTPATGIYKHKKGSAVTYSYSLQSGYEQLQVKVDGVAASASGTITMDAAHTLSVTAVRSVAGSYSGTTNQGYPITLTCSLVGGISHLTYFQIKMKSLTNNLGYYIIITVTGWPSKMITNLQFSYDGTYVDLVGTFVANALITASGTWSLYYNSIIYGIFTGTGTWNVTATAKAMAGPIVPVKPGEVKTTAEIYKDGRLIQRVDL
jgi:hypothetical protein